MDALQGSGVALEHVPTPSQSLAKEQIFSLVKHRLARGGHDENGVDERDLIGALQRGQPREQNLPLSFVNLIKRIGHIEEESWFRGREV